MALARRQRQIIARGNGRWLVCVSICRDHRTRRCKKLDGTIRDGVRAAQRDLVPRLEESDQAREPDAARLTLNQYLDRWLELAVRLKLRAKSFADYEALLGRYIRPSLGQRELSSLAPLDFQSVYYRMRASGLSPRTVRYTHSVLHAALEQAVRWRLIERNPASGVEIPNPIRREMRVLNPAEARRFLDHAGKTRYGVLLALALTTGMRPSEYLALRWSDVDWQEETVTVSRSLEKGSGWKFADTKRARSRRPVKLESWVASRLRQMYSIDAARPSTSPEVAQQIFKTRLGRPINSNYLARRFKQLLREAGLPMMRLYDLRHTAATLALAAGVPAKVVSEQLGHASSAFTLDVYSHVLPHMQAEAAKRVEALLGMNGNEQEGIRSGQRERPEQVPGDGSPTRSNVSLPELADPA